MKVYMAGLIEYSVIDKCIQWRKQIVDHYSNWKNSGKVYGDICFIDPTNGESGFSNNGTSTLLPSKVILEKDYMAINKCDLFIANMDSFGVTRPLIGTIMEIAFAYTWHKPIIMITTDALYKNHSFVSNMVSWYFESVEDMLDKKAIQQYFKAWHSAKY